VQSALEYFQKEKAFERGLKLLAEIYDNGRKQPGLGSIKIHMPTKEEGRVWSEFFGKNYTNQKILRIGLGEFSRRFSTVFPTDDISALMETYAPTSMYEYASLNDAIELALLPKYVNTYADSWLESLCSRKGNQYHSIFKFYLKDRVGTINMLDKTAKILRSLSADLFPIDILSQKFFSAPCMLDFGTEYGDLLLAALSHYHEQRIPDNRHDATLLYLKAGIIAEDSTYLVATKGLVSPKVDFLTLRQVCRLKCSEIKNVYVIEDTRAFDKVHRLVNLKKGVLLSPINSHNPAFLHLVDKLIQNGAIIYYSGMFDYAPLTRADKLCETHGKQLIPWRYSKEDYELATATDTEFLRDRKREISMKNESLALVLSQMRKKGKKAGLLPLVPSLVSDIIKYEE